MDKDKKTVMNTLTDLQHKLVGDLRISLLDYEAALFEHRLVKLDCKHRRPLLTHLGQLRELLERLEDVLEEARRGFRERASEKSYL